MSTRKSPEGISTRELPLTPLLLVASANSFVRLGAGFGPDLRHVQVQLVESYLRDQCRVGKDGQGESGAGEDDDPAAPWDAAFVSYVGYWSHYDQRVERSAWPLPVTKRIDELAQFAFTSGLIRSAPVAGDVFLAWDRTLARFARTGIVVHARKRGRRRAELCDFTCTTIEGSGEHLLSASGMLSLRRERVLSPEMGDRVIRWTGLDKREERPEVIERAADRITRSAAA